MTDDRENGAATTSNWPVEFGGGVAPLVAFVVAASVLLTVVNVLQARWYGPETSTLLRQLGGVPVFLLQGAIAWLVLRYEGVRLRDVGFAPSLFVPAAVALGGVVVALNVVATGLALLAGRGVSFGYVLVGPPAATAAALLTNYLFVGPVEELMTRGYLQNKLIASLGGRRDRLRPALGIAATSVAFAAMHVPTLLQEGVRVAQLPPALSVLLFTGVAFGVVYELTHNLYLLAGLHAIGNTWPIVVDPGPWPNWPVVVALYGILVLTYRRWAAETSRPTFGVPG